MNSVGCEDEIEELLRIVKIADEISHLDVNLAEELLQFVILQGVMKQLCKIYFNKKDDI